MSFNHMFSRLQELQLCLPCSHHSDDLPKSRLLVVCVNVDAWRLARPIVFPTLMGVVADIQTSMLTHKKTMESSNTSALVTDRRRFQQTGVRTWRGRRNKRPARKWFVCKKFECWSTKYISKKGTHALKEKRVSWLLLRIFMMSEMADLVTINQTHLRIPKILL